MYHIYEASDLLSETSTPCTSTWTRRPERRPTPLDSLQKSDHPTLVAQCHVFLRSVRRNSGKIADKNSREEKIYNMRPADRSQCHRQPHHHLEVRDYPDTPLRFQNSYIENVCHTFIFISLQFKPLLLNVGTWSFWISLMCLPWLYQRHLN